MPRGGLLLLDIKPNVYYVSDHKSKKCDVNAHMISTLNHLNPFEALNHGQNSIHQWMGL